MNSDQPILNFEVGQGVSDSQTKVHMKSCSPRPGSIAPGQH
jgi:hypothetical protein